MTNMHDEIEQRLKELMKLKNELPKLIVDLYWEYDRMTSSGQKSLDKLARLNGVPTEREIQKTLKQCYLSSIIMHIKILTKHSHQ